MQCSGENLVRKNNGAKQNPTDMVGDNKQQQKMGRNKDHLKGLRWGPILLHEEKLCYLVS